MKQQVNLYQPPPPKRRPPVSAVAIIQLSILAVLAMGGMYYMELERYNALNEQIVKLQDREQKQLAQVEELAKKFPKKKKSQQLARKIELLKAEHGHKLRVLEKLKDPAIGTTEGFSSYFDGLARQHFPEIWLTGIHINDGGTQLKLNGSALEAKQVPKYLQRLASEDDYNGRSFQTFSLSRLEDEAWRINFTIDTKAIEEEGTR